jgi:predicted GIY-YIG superfamily endonuclease
MMSSAMSDYFVYLVTNKPRGTLYVGVTNDLVRRIYEHREEVVPGLTKRYGLKQLVHFERYDTRPILPSSERRTSGIGRDFESLNWLSHRIRNGAMSMTRSPVEAPHGCPGQARA